MGSKADTGGNLMADTLRRAQQVRDKLIGFGDGGRVEVAKAPGRVNLIESIPTTTTDVRRRRTGKSLWQHLLG